jgi:WD40 repeat protein
MSIICKENALIKKSNYLIFYLTTKVYNFNLLNMVKLQNENIIKQIFISFSLHKISDLVNGIQNTSLFNISLRTYNYKTIYRSIGKIKFLMKTQKHFPNSLHLLPNGDIISLSWGDIITIWNPNDYSIIKSIDNDNLISSLAVLPNSYIVTNSNVEFKVWDISNDSFTCIKYKYLKGYVSIVYLSLLSNGCLAYSAHDCDSYYILIVDCNDDFNFVKRIEDYNCYTHSIANLQSDQFASAHSTGCIKVRSIANDYKYFQTLKGHNNMISTLLYMEKSNVLLSGSWDCTIMVWNMDDYKYIKIIDNEKGLIYDLMSLPFCFFAVLSPISIEIFGNDYECINTIEGNHFKNFLLLKDNKIASLLDNGKIIILDA